MPIVVGTRLVLLGGGVGATFSPSGLSPHLWLDPSDPATLFQDSAHSTPVAANNDPVGAILNKGSVGDYFVQATSGARPLFKTGAGLSKLYFDGVNDFLAGSAASNYLTVGTYDIVIAARAVTVTTDSNPLYFNDSVYFDANGYLGLMFRSTGKIDVYNFVGTVDGAEDDAAVGTAFVAHARHVGGNISLTVNAQTTVTVASGNTGDLSGALWLGRNNTNTFTEVEIFGLVARKTTFSASELASLKTWLGAKAGLVL